MFLVSILTILAARCPNLTDGIALCLGAVAPLLGPTPAARLATINAALAPLDDAACNAHLAMFILDLFLLTVFPELGVKDEV